MAIEFDQPITAGTVLIREDIRSQNFVAGSAGWRIEADGDAEFNQVVIRGGTVVSGTALYYDGTPAAGNLVLSISANGGTDAFGNVYVGGLGIYDTDGSQIQLESGAGATQYFTPQDVSSMVWVPGVITTTIGASSRPGLELSSPNEDSNAVRASIDLFGGSSTTSDTSILVGADRVNFSDNVEITGLLTTYGSFTTYTPAITGDGGTATYTTKTGYWTRVGQMIYFVAYVVVNAAGSGATPITITGPVSIDRSTRQSVPANGDSMTGNSGSLTVLSLTGGSGAVFDRVRNSTGSNLTGASLQAGATLTVEGWYREA